MKTFKFPAGTTKIDKKELKEVFSKYERVEIPGTVFRIDGRFDNNDSSRFVVKELVLNEGTQSLILFANNTPSVNVPKSLLEIETSAQLPRVLCLPENFIRLNWGINGVEYLQAYGESEVRYCFDKNSKIKHYVLLGNKLTPKQYLFDNIPDGCVIHVESEKMAEKVFKKGGFDVTKVYVIADAQEWKDFPADKLALTMEEYDPESRILPLQKKIREQKLQQRAEKERRTQEERRQRQKDKMVASMTKPIIQAALEPLCDSCTISKVDNDRDTITVSVSLDAIKWFDHRDRLVGTRLEISSSMDNIVENAQKMAKVLSGLKDFFQRYAGDMERLEMRMQESVNTWMHVDWNILLATRCQGISITAIVKRDNIVEDSKVFTTFTEELDSILTHAKYDENINVKIGTE